LFLRILISLSILSNKMRDCLGYSLVNMDFYGFQDQY